MGRSKTAKYKQLLLVGAGLWLTTTYNACGKFNAPDIVNEASLASSAANNHEVAPTPAPPISTPPPVQPPSNGSFEFTGLVNGIESRLSNEGHTSWASDSTGSFARISWPAGGGVGGLRYTLQDRNQRQVYIEFEMRNSRLDKNSKTLKIFGQGYRDNPNVRYSNCTWGTYYNGGNFAINYGDREYNGGTGTNDTQIGFQFGPVTFPNVGNGSDVTRAPYPVQNYMPGSSTIPDTGWHKYAYWQRFSNGSPDGEFAMWMDGKLLMHVSGMWNASSGQSLRDMISIGDYTQGNQVAFTQDFRNLKIGFTRPAIVP